MNGLIFNIQGFCTDDGPGIRTTVFFMGCPLRCIWCHNPESQTLETKLFYYSEKCVGCGRCVQVCPNKCHTLVENIHCFDRQNCNLCGACVEKCYTGAMKKVGYEISASDVIGKLLKDKVFYDKSGGGITISGGEPFLQFEFAYEVLKLAKENGLHTCLETCGYASEEKINTILPFVDIFLYDFKLSDSKLHKEYCKVDNEQIIKNLEIINSAGKDIILSCIIIPGVNDTAEHFAAIADLANRLDKITKILLRPYHSLGESKYMALGQKYLISNIKNVDETKKLLWMNSIQKLTNKPVALS